MAMCTFEACLAGLGQTDIIHICALPPQGRTSRDRNKPSVFVVIVSLASRCASQGYLWWRTAVSEFQARAMGRKVGSDGWGESDRRTDRGRDETRES